MIGEGDVITALIVIHGQLRQVVHVASSLTVGEAALEVAMALSIDPNWPGLLLVNHNGDPMPATVNVAKLHGKVVGLRTQESLTHSGKLTKAKRQ